MNRPASSLSARVVDCIAKIPAVAWDARAAAPLYVKSHSQGEYVFDHGWAEAYERAGGRYYPKLQVAAPFTPVPGPRLFVRPGPYSESVCDAMIDMLAKTAS